MDTVDLLISGVLALIMFGIGASLKPKDFKDLFLYPRALILGLILQMIFLPVLAGIVAYFAPINPYLKVGLIILSLCPGGATSNFISYILGLETALSISLTTINSFLILLTIPLGTNLALQFFIGEAYEIILPVLDTILNILLVVLFPAGLGLLFNTYFEKRSSRLQRYLKVLNILLLGIIFAIKFFADEESGGVGMMWSDIWSLLPVTLILHLLAMVLGFILANAMLNSRSHAVTIGIEVGLQNTALALIVTSTLLTSNEMAKPVLVYALFSFFTTFLFGLFASNKGLAVLRRSSEKS